MEEIKIEKVETINPEDRKIFDEGMLAYHASKGHIRKKESTSFLLKTAENQLIGAVVVTFLWNGMEIDSLWVDESQRGKGYGRKLMEVVEEEGRKRGAKIAYTNTFSYQAPEFYEKLGYTLYGKLDNFPEGESLSYYSKKLS
jgi:GNAT superfamily N-acetyltransferase